jgi:diguanylate cyclase (GGDEF)-like protein
LHDVLQSIYRLARLGSREPGLAAVQRALAEEIVAALGADDAHVVALGEGRPGAGITAVHGGGCAEFVLSPGGHGEALAWVAASGEALVVPDTGVAGTLPADLVQRHGTESAVVLPVGTSGGAHVLAIAGRRHRRPWPPESLRAAQALCAVAGTAIALHDARLAAAIDPLTGCLNHGAMRERLSEEIARARRHGTALSLMILDLDDFKRVNDTYGHPTGDALLRHVGDALRNEFRSFDQVARYGGDEFVVILPNVHGARADTAATRAVRLLREIHIARDDGGHEGITVSAGIAEWVGPEGAGDLLERADTALRASKADGKDGVARAPAPSHR